MRNLKYKKKVTVKKTTPIPSPGSKGEKREKSSIERTLSSETKRPSSSNKKIDKKDKKAYNNKRSKSAKSTETKKDKALNLDSINRFVHQSGSYQYSHARLVKNLMTEGL